MSYFFGLSLYTTLLKRYFVDIELQFSFVCGIGHYVCCYPVDREFAVMFFGVEFTAVFKRFALDKHRSLFVVETGGPATVCHTDQFMGIGKPLTAFERTAFCSDTFFSCCCVWFAVSAASCTCIVNRTYPNYYSLALLGKSQKQSKNLQSNINH